LIQVEWLLAERREVPEDDGWLSPEECKTLEALRLPKRRDDWRLGRWAAKQAISAFLGCPPGEIEVRSAPDGAPEAFLAGKPAPVSLSLSHRNGRAACAVVPHGIALGCDL
jgi:4'-phosphopantetheinyl transferase